MARPYADYIKVNKDFVPVFDANMDKKYPSHWLSFYPHDTFKVILNDLIGSLEGDSSEKRRSIWMSGAYGTGKSFASFTMKHIIEDELNLVKTYFNKYNISMSLHNRLERVKSEGDIVVVNRSSSGGIVGNNQLFSAVAESIKTTLRKRGYSYTGGRTLYEKVLSILKDPNSPFNFKGAYENNKGKFTDCASADEVVSELEYLGADDSLELLQTIIDIADSVGFNFAQSEIEIVEWIRDVINTNKIKIVFIWDEFSGYFLRNQQSIDGLQELAHASFDMPFYFLLITHKRHDQFIHETDRRMILEARFKMNKIDMVPTTAFMLMRNAIEIDTDLNNEWENNKANLWFNVEKMVHNSLGVYAKDIKDEDLKGLLPLHPFAAFMLQNISREVNSNQRTMFQFLCGDPNASENAKNNFRWFIENSDINKWTYLTCDFIWDYFFHYNNNDLDEDAKNAINHFSTFEKQCANENEKRVLKVALLLKAMKGEKGRGIGNLLRPTLSNIVFAFAGTDLKDDISSIMDGFVKKSIFGSVPEGDRDFLYVTQSQTIDEEKYKEMEDKARRTFSFETIISNPEYGLTSAFNLTGYFPLRFESICATHKNIKHLVSSKLREIDVNKTLLVYLFANSDEDKAKNREIIKALNENKCHNLIIVDLSNEPLSKGDSDEYERFIKSAALYFYFEKSDGGQASLKLKEAKEVIATWKKRLYDSTIILHHSESSPVSFASTNQFASRIAERNISIFKYCIESVVDSENVFKTNFSADVAVIGMGKKSFPSTYNYLSVWKDKLARENIWNNADYATTMPSHPVAQMKQAVDKFIDGKLKANENVNISDVWNLLKSKPFGLLPCAGGIFIFGFIMKEYADCGFYKKNSVKYPTPLSASELADMIHGIMKALRNADTLSIVSMTEPQKKFCKVSGDIFKLPPQNQNSVQDIMIGIKERLPNDGFPLWALKYYIKSNDRHGLSDAVLPIIDGYCRFVAPNDNETQIAEEIIALFDRDAGIKEYLCEVYNSKNLRLGMECYVEEHNQNLVRIAEEIGDDNKYIELIKSRLSPNTNSFSSWLWEKGTINEQIDAVYLEYRLINAVNKIIASPVKKLEDAAFALQNRISSIKMPFDFFKLLVPEIDKLMKHLVEIYRTGSFKEINEEELISCIDNHGDKFTEFFLNGQKVFSLALRAKLNDEELNDEDIGSIYGKLESKAIDGNLDSFVSKINVMYDEIKKAQKFNQLLEVWKKCSGGYETPIKWSEATGTPIMCLFSDNLSVAKEVFDIINAGRGSTNDEKIKIAIDFISTQSHINELSNKEFCDNMFFEFVSGEYGMLLSNIDEVRTLLVSKLQNVKVYDWYSHKVRIDSIIKEYAEEKFKEPQFVGSVMSKIDKLSPEKAKEYLKELASKEPLVGIKIMKSK